jgi:hypothetical protein
MNPIYGYRGEDAFLKETKRHAFIKNDVEHEKERSFTLVPCLKLSPFQYRKVLTTVHMLLVARIGHDHEKSLSLRIS